MTGYSRLRATAVGSGAAELLWTVVSRLSEDDTTGLRANTHAVFDRTLYVAIPVAGRSRGPSLIALAVEDIRPGPLVMHLETPATFSFRQFGSRGTACTVSLGASPDQPSRLEFQFDRGGTVCLELDHLPPLPAETVRCGSVPLSAYARDSCRLGDLRRLVGWLTTTGTDDGLGTLDELDAYLDGVTCTEFGSLVDATVTWLLWPDECQANDAGKKPAGEAPTLAPLRGLLGLGPGATPSGDDFLLGLLLVLSGIEDARVRGRVQSLGEELLTYAASTTTAVSCAILSQGLQRRASEPAVSCLAALSDHDASAEERRTACDVLVQQGDTSGADTLAGLLTGLTAVLPALAGQRPRRWREQNR